MSLSPRLGSSEREMVMGWLAGWLTGRVAAMVGWLVGGRRNEDDNVVDREKMRGKNIVESNDFHLI